MGKRIEGSRGYTINLGYGHLVAYNSTHLYWEQIKDITFEVEDYVWIIKSN